MNDSNVFYVPGPMHPDLFDGETPIMLPVKVGKDVKAYSVTLSFSGEYTKTLLADSEEDAREQLKNRLHFDINTGDADEVNVYAREIKNPRITQPMVDAWRKWSGEEEAA